MDRRNKHCVHCGDEFEPDSRVKDQRYCKKEECQKARRALWQKERLRDDPDYKDNQKRCWKEWYSRHPGYYREYRGKNTKYAEANRLRQKLRDMKRRKSGLDKLLAKMDSIDNRLCRRNGGTFKLIPKDSKLLAKMDVMTVELIPV